MPLAFGAHAGSLLALTGTPVNVIVSDCADDAGVGRFGFFEFALVGVPLVAGTVAIVVLFGERLLPDRPARAISRDFGDHARTLAEQYALDDDPDALLDAAASGAAEVVIPPRSALVGETAFPGMAPRAATSSCSPSSEGAQRPGGRDRARGGRHRCCCRASWGALERHLDDPDVLASTRRSSSAARRCRSAPERSGRSPSSSAMVLLLATGAVPPAVAGLLAAGAIILLGVLTSSRPTAASPGRP